MTNIRLIARLDIKGPNLIKGVQLEGLRIIGDPNAFAMRYYQEGADELLYMDSVASLYGRNNLSDVVRYTAQNIFIPFTVGGGIRNVGDVDTLLRAGADKVAINTAAIQRPMLITDVAKHFGSQCMVLSIEAKHKGNGHWEAYSDNGREPSHKDVVHWAKQGESLGAGEIVLTSVDCDGMRKGFNTELIHAVSSAVTIPVIASGGFGELKHLSDAVFKGNADAVAIATALHYQQVSFNDMRHYATTHNITVRQPS
ncbi:MAG: imidazole glycerol phosphate synthase subunit HisF [Gammaproteobacteria bacterium]|nr:imidazole glycerol phosphate synthase subunit HisF [Gammaproteobacteria bacterium]